MSMRNSTSSHFLNLSFNYRTGTYGSHHIVSQLPHSPVRTHRLIGFIFFGNFKPQRLLLLYSKIHKAERVGAFLPLSDCSRQEDFAAAGLGIPQRWALHRAAFGDAAPAFGIQIDW